MRSSRPASSRPSGPSSSARAAAFLAVALFLASCSGRPRPIVALDEAFAAARPGLAALLQDDGSWDAGPFGRLGKPLVLPVSLGESPAKALDAANAELKRGGSATAIVASPLVAKALVEGGSWSGDPLLLVPEWRGGALPGLRSIGSDPLPAYRAAGSAAGAYIASLAGSGGSPSCGILYSEAPTRPRAALAAFEEAYALASKGGPLQVRELEEEESPPEATGSAPHASADGGAEAAVAELLGADLRLLFVALGRDAGAAIRAAARPGLAIGADFPYPEAPPSLAFKIAPDEAATAKAIVSELRGRSLGSAGASSEAIPALLVAGAQASSIRAGGSDFRSLVEGAALRAKGPR
jgi:hypothetical protein